MKITLAQQEIIWGDKKHNLATFDKALKDLYGKTDLVVLPEMFSTGFRVDQPELGEETDGETMQIVKKWAKEGNFAIASSFMSTIEGKTYNKGFFCQPDGTINFGDKRHLFIGDEQVYFTPGNKHLDVTYKGVKIRVLICFDLRFPVWSRNFSGDEYDVLIYTANWPAKRIEAWDALTPARAIENQAYVCAVNAIGTDYNGIEHNGHSRMFDPRGNILAEFEDWEAGTRTVDIDMECIKHAREKMPFWKSADQFSIK